MRSHRSNPTLGALKRLTSYTLPRRDVVDIIAFSILIFSVKRELPASSLGITTLWNIILRDGTVYFVIVFLIQLFALLFLFTGPVGGISFVRRRWCAHRDCVSGIAPDVALSVSSLSLTLI